MFNDKFGVVIWKGLIEKKPDMGKIQATRKSTFLMKCRLLRIFNFVDNLFATDYNKNNQMIFLKKNFPVCLIKEIISYLKLPLTSCLCFISLHQIIKTIDIKNIFD